MSKPSPLAKSFGKKVVKEWLGAGEELDRFFQTLPPWIQNISIQMDKSISKAHGFQESNEFTPTMMGILAGQMVASSKLKIEKKPEEKIASSRMKKAIREARGLTKGISPFLSEFDRAMCKHVDSLSIKEQSLFYAAKAKALEKNSLGVTFWESSTTRLYVTLLVLAPHMPQIRSVRELHDILCRIMGKAVVGDVKRLEAVCRRIELKFRAPGRPRGVPPRKI